VEVPAKPPVEAAPAIVRELIAPAAGGGGVPSRADLVAAVRRFAQVEFDVPDGPGADGFLFQYGPANWFPEPTFVLGVARQFEVLDDAGEHGCYYQLNLEYRYPADADLDSAGTRTEWWFRDEPTSFDDWLGSVERDQIWQVTSTKPVGEFAVYLDEV
jgi:hypothetical protein